MTRNRTLGVLLVAALGLLAVTPAWAAQLTKVTADWKGGASGLPSDVSMYIYVPDKVATNPPILTLIHYCGGSASSVFSQASTVIKVVDENGVIVVAPDNGARCWDVQTTKGLTRDGGGDTHAIKQMVLYAITTYKANPDRVYSTGDSSGGMTTQLLLALYPDIFKGGASFAGIPAGCRTGNETGNGYSSACAGGSITYTAQEWGDIVRKMDPGYSGYRPRVQLFHGDQDQYISYKVHAEAIKEWSNILGLDATTPTSTSTVTLGSHQASRQTWKNSCGFVVLDAFLSAGGDHGPSDALFNSYVAPFLGLDKTGAVDPEIEQCGDGTGGADGGASGAGGSGGGGTGGSSGATDGGVGGSAGNTGAGGSAGSGGSVPTGGSHATGGSSGSGGNNSQGGALGTGATGGSSGSGGNSSKGTGGSQATGGSSNGTGGAQGSGGAVGTGGKSSTGGSAGSGSGGTSSKGGAAGNSTASGSGSNGCSVVLGRPNSNKDVGIAMLVLGLALATFARRRHSKL
jgi:poly(hydroxyalkanoate) depolymerase family esterase